MTSRTQLRVDLPTRRGELPSRVPGLLMGLGFGGSVDGIVLHQVLQWHSGRPDRDG